jgi:TRAP-type C4-dicarboxylate transport system permease small subunit
VERLARTFYQALLALACVAMVLSFASVVLGIVAREALWNLQGFDAYAGFAIAMALFLALPETFRHGDHIRVKLLLERLPRRARAVLEYWCLGAGLLLAVFVAYFSCRLVWISYVTGDVSPAIDATPLWIPQICVALGCVGFALALFDALRARLAGREEGRAKDIGHFE